MVCRPTAAVSLVVCVAFSAVGAAAQDRPDLSVTERAHSATHEIIPLPLAPAHSAAAGGPGVGRGTVRQPWSFGTRLTFGSLYTSTAALQALDVHSTYRALGRGAVERNQLVAVMVDRRSTLVATKAAVTVGTIYATHQVAKRNKWAALLLLGAINGSYAFIVKHNYDIADR